LSLICSIVAVVLCEPCNVRIGLMLSTYLVLCEPPFAVVLIWRFVVTVSLFCLRMQSYIIEVVTDFIITVCWLCSHGG